MPASSPDSLSDEQRSVIMEAVGVGIAYGLDIAEKRIRGDFEIEPLSWERVQAKLKRDD